MEGDSYDYIIKIMLIGDTGVGKSSILLRYDEDKFNDNLFSTIGIDYKIKILNINNEKIKVQIWDTAGQERFKNITNAFYRGAMAIFLIYDVTERESFHNIKLWMQNINNHAVDDVVKILVATKCDLFDRREVTIEEGQELANSYNIKFYETSARLGTNIETLFYQTVQDVMTTTPHNVIKIPTLNLSNLPPEDDMQRLNVISSNRVRTPHSGSPKSPMDKRSQCQC